MSIICSTGWSCGRMISTILSVSRLYDTGAPDFASKTTTPTGQVSIRASRSDLARRSSRYLLALAMTSAAWEANITKVSSSSRVNSPPVSPFATHMKPNRTPLLRMGATSREAMATGGSHASTPSDLKYEAGLLIRNGSGTLFRWCKNSALPGRAAIWRCSSGVRPELTNSSSRLS